MMRKSRLSCKPFVGLRGYTPTSHNMSKVGIFKSRKCQICPQDLPDIFPVKITETYESGLGVMGQRRLSVSHLWLWEGTHLITFAKLVFLESANVNLALKTSLRYSSLKSQTQLIGITLKVFTSEHGTSTREVSTEDFLYSIV